MTAPVGASSLRLWGFDVITNPLLPPGGIFVGHFPKTIYGNEVTVEVHLVIRPREIVREGLRKALPWLDVDPPALRIDPSATVALTVSRGTQ